MAGDHSTGDSKTELTRLQGQRTIAVAAAGRPSSCGQASGCLGAWVPYLIDGHNLIAQMSAIRLADPDDEARLCAALRLFCSRTNSQATVYFDQGRPGGEDPARAGGLSVRFTRPPKTADEAIRAHLGRLRGEARNWTVVSSDAEVRRAAERAGARTLNSREFARRVEAPRRTPAVEKPEAVPSADDVAYWERQFRRKRRR